MTKEVLKQALNALKVLLDEWTPAREAQLKGIVAITAIEQALSRVDEPVAWLLPDDTVNSLVVESIEQLIQLCKDAHMADIKVRVNGEDKWFQADWVKYLKRAAPQQAMQANAVTPKADCYITPELARDIALHKSGMAIPISASKLPTERKIVPVFVCSIHAAPQASQPLTDEAIQSIMEQMGVTVAGPASEAIEVLARAIERAHGIKGAPIQHLPADDTEGGAL